MKRWLGSVWLVFLVCATVFGADSYIQVMCDPGVKIFLDGEFKGISTDADGGFIIEKVVPGTHRLKAVLDGFAPQAPELVVADGEVKACRLDSFVPADAAKAEPGAQQVGTLIIQSVPIDCEITISGTTYTPRNAHHKTEDKWMDGAIPAGPHTVSATAHGKVLKHEIDLANQELIHLMFNFMSGEVEVLTAARIAPGGAIGLAGSARTVDLGDGGSLELMSVPAGVFMMGSKKGWKGNEKPQHQVMFLQPFWMAKTEVTQRQYQQVMGINPAKFKGLENPVETVSWDDAMAFCKKLTDRERQAGRLPEGFEYTLPSEAQWEYACRAGLTKDYAGSLDEMGWYGKNCGEPQPVAQKTPNAWGLYDMYGNVWEWCKDDWHKSYADAPGDGASWGAGKGTFRVLRGGSWDSKARDCRSRKRRSDEKQHKTRYCGFRPIVQ